ncbi:hypothetical protein HON22_00605 [Candidatus Peregrinibacteria bacterium]|jgi:glutamate synthase domain-containing protein 2|nr:hypothetical protein [Candidatus Peregrinibacteria bacterium]
MNISQILLITFFILASSLLLIFVYDRFFQSKNLVLARFPLLGRGRYLAHHLRGFIRQYFFDDDDFTNRLTIDWILNVSAGKSGYFGFDKFDSTHQLHDGKLQMIHSATPKNNDEMKVVYPILGEGKRKHPMQFQSYFYRSAMSLGAIGFEATSAMFAACADIKAPANTGEGGFSIHHLPRLPFSYDKKFLKYIQVPKIFKIKLKLIPGKRLKNRFIDFLAWMYTEKGLRDSYLFDQKNFVFYKINWKADISHFPKPEDLTDEYGHVIFQIGSNLYGLRKATKDHSIEFDWDRFRKITSFCRAIEIKLAQGAKQSGGVLKAEKNTPVIAEIRGMHSGIDLISPNRFPFYEEGKEKEFLEFCNKLSIEAGGKPVGAKVVIADESNVETLMKTMTTSKTYLDFLTVDGGDGGSGAAPIALSVLFGKKIDEAVPLVDSLLKKHSLRDRVKILASSKVYAPYMSAHILALGADAIGNARSIMIAGGCIRAGLCSGEYGSCPVGLATMKKSNRRAYAQAWDEKVIQIGRYIKEHNHGIEQVAAICGVTSPSLLNTSHIALKNAK